MAQLVKVRFFTGLLSPLDELLVKLDQKERLILYVRKEIMFADEIEDVRPS